VKKILIINGHECQYLNRFSVPRWSRPYFEDRFRLIDKLLKQYKAAETPNCQDAIGRTLLWFEAEFQALFEKSEAGLERRAAMNAFDRDAMTKIAGDFQKQELFFADLPATIEEPEVMTKRQYNRLYGAKAMSKVFSDLKVTQARLQSVGPFVIKQRRGV
jgi:hypothetical protein